MEALPRLPMLAFELKHSPEYIEFGPTLKQYIKDHYGEDPALYNKACTDLEQLRQAAIQVSRDYMGCITLKKYYAQLQYLQGRFPMGDGEEAAISFTWEDVQTGRDHVISDIKFEQACILYNIGCLHSLLGVLDTRHNAEGMKVSCTHFQCAAWAFEHLRDNFGSSSMSTDMSYELLSFHIILMLAQAQECILEKSMIDNRKNNITAKVAAQVVEYYKDSSRLIDLAEQKQQINSRMHKEWGRRLQMKATFYQCITYYFLGRQAEESEKPGECLAYYTAAKEELARTSQMAKNEVSEVVDCLTFAKDVVMGKYESAKKDNDFVYHDKVPAIEGLPEVKGASLVKGIPFNPSDKEISGPDIFEKLVPMEAHEASSVYSEEKAKLSRTVVGEIEQKNMELDQFLSSLQLDMEQLMPKPDLIPENLMEKCAAMSVRTNTVKELTDSMASVSGLATEVQLNIEEIQQMVDEDNEKTDQFEKQYGKKNPSSVLPRLLEDLVEYCKRHEEGSQLNTTLHKAMNTHTSNLKTLALPPTEILTLLPPSQPKLSPENEAVVSDLRRLMQKVTEMKEQRNTLLEQFREQIQKDDITNVLVTQETVDRETVFAQQLKKHDQIVGYIKQNLSAQDNILRHLTDTNAKYALIRQAFNEAHVKREKVVQDLIMSYERYEDLLAKSKKGVDYYKKLHENVTRTLERCRSECKVRQEERDMLLTKFAPKVPAPSRPLAPKPGSSNTATPTSVPATPDLVSVPDFLTLPPGPESFSASVSSQLSSQFQNLPPTFEGPKLKDYLPFMKPRSFGPKPSVGALPSDQNVASSSTIAPDVAQFDSDDFNTGQRYPGLDPSLASVLPATIAQYLASVSSASTFTAAGSARHSVSPTSSPQHKGSPRHTPSPLTAVATPPGSPVVFQGPQLVGGPKRVRAGQPVRYSSPAPGDAAGPQVSDIHTYPASYPQQNLPDTYMQQNIAPSSVSMYAVQPSAGHQQIVSGQPFVGTTSGQHQPYQLYGYMPGINNPQQYTSSASRQSSTSIVSSANKPIFSSGQISVNQAPVQQPHQPLPPHQLPQYTAYGTPQQPQQMPHSMIGQLPMPLQSTQQYIPPPNAPLSQPQYGPVPSAAISQPAPPPTNLPQWQQNAFSIQGQVPSVPSQLSSGLGQIPPSQVQSQYSHGNQPFLQSQSTPVSSQNVFGMGGYELQSQRHPQLAQPVNPPQQQQTSQVSGQVAPQQNFGFNVSAANQQHLPEGYGELSGSQQPPGARGTPQHTGGSMQQVGKDVTQQALASHQGVPFLPGHTHPQQVPSTSVGYTYYMDQRNLPLASNLVHPSDQHYQQINTTTYQPTLQYKGGYQHSVQQSYQNAQTYGSFTSKAMVYGQSGQPLSTQSQSHHNTQTVFSQGQGQAGQFSSNQQIQGQQSQFPGGSQLQNQAEGSPVPPAQGQPMRAQVQAVTGQSQQVVGQMAGQGSKMPGHLQQLPGSILTPQTSSPAPQIPGQMLASQGPQLQDQTSQHPLLPHGSAPQIPGQMLASQGPQLQDQTSQHPLLPHGPVPCPPHTNLPHMQHQFASQAAPHQQQQQQQQPNQRLPQQPLPSHSLPQQQQPYLQQQPHLQQQPPQLGFQQQVPPAQQATFTSCPPQPGLQPQIPHLQQHQQMTTPYGPPQHLPVQDSNQIPASPALGVGPSLAGIQVPLQPMQSSSVPSAVRAGTPSQVLSRPSTPGGPISNTPSTPISPVASRRSFSKQISSLDEILSSSPNGVKDTIITPQVLTDQERQLQKEEAMKNQALVPVSEPYSTQGALNKLLSDVEAYGKFVDELSVTILGVSRLDTVWKSLLDSQDLATKKMSMAIARCYPMKNRDADIMPYDETRVILTTTKDDYINASWLNDLAPSCPKFITTQAPMSVTMGEFWAMVYEQSSEVLVQITSEYETGKKFPVYYPTEKDKPMEQGVMLLSLQSVKFRQHWVERIVYLKNTQTKQARTLVHLQFKNWPVSGFPDDVSSIVHFISEVHNFYMQQRSLTKPIIVHCGSSIGRTGVFALVYTAMQEVVHGNGLIDVPGLARRMLQRRRGILHKKEQLKCCYDAVLCFAEEYLEKRGVLVKKPHFSSSKKQLTIGSPKHQRHSTPAPDDIVLGTVDLQTIRENVGRLHVQGNSEDKKREDSSNSMDQSSSKKSLESLSSFSNSSLPDVVRQHHDAQNNIDMDKNGDYGSLWSMESSATGVYSTQLSSGPQSISSGSQSTAFPMDSNFSQTKQPTGSLSQTGGNSFVLGKPGSVGGLPPVSTIPSSLAQLQDPATFTMGSPDAKKKNKITKSNFNQSVGSLQNPSSDPLDPLGSLDPLWTLGKK